MVTTVFEDVLARVRDEVQHAAADVLNVPEHKGRKQDDRNKDSLVAEISYKKENK